MPELFCEVIKKNPTERIHVIYSDYKHSRRIILRQFYLSDAGEWLPTKLGFVMPAEDINLLVVAVNHLKTAIDYDGIPKPEEEEEF